VNLIKRTIDLFTEATIRSFMASNNNKGPFDEIESLDDSKDDGDNKKQGEREGEGKEEE
jgi:hypothetical protein